MLFNNAVWSLRCTALIASLSLFVNASPTASGTPVQLKPFPINNDEDPQPVSDIIPVTHYINVTELLLPGNNLTLPEDALATTSKRMVKRQTGLYQYSDSTNWPFKSVGRVAGPGFVCTGSLVSRRLILTARHCATADGSYSFSPGYDNGATPHGTANVVYKAVPIRSSNCNDIPEDFAFMALDTDFGPDYFNIHLPDSSFYNKKLFIQMGYPSSDTTYRQDQLSITQESDQCSSINGNFEAMLVSFEISLVQSSLLTLEFQTADAVSNPGSSGSPLWTFPAEIFGVASSIIVTPFGGYPTLYAAGVEMKVTLDNLRAYFG